MSAKVIKFNRQEYTTIRKEEIFVRKNEFPELFHGSFKITIEICMDSTNIPVLIWYINDNVAEREIWDYRETIKNFGSNFKNIVKEYVHLQLLNQMQQQKIN